MHIPFLRLIPDSVYFTRIETEFVVPNAMIQIVRTTLEQALDSYVMTYSLNGFDEERQTKHHLCQLVKQAQLSLRQFDIYNFLKNE